MNRTRLPTVPADRGFTLIELLVVISIIAILASMLLPAIGMIRDLANAQKCGSTLRQWQLANLTYATDNEGMTMPVWGGPNFKSWYQFDSILDIIDARLTGSGMFGGNWYFGDPANAGLRCPVAPADGRPFGFVYGYGGSNRKANDIAAATTYRSLPLEKVPTKADKIALCDSYGAVEVFAWGTVHLPDEDTAIPDPTAWGYNLSGAGGAMGMGVCYRHRAKAEGAYWDGHVGAFRQSAVDSAWYEQPVGSGIWFNRMFLSFED